MSRRLRFLCVFLSLLACSFAAQALTLHDVVSKAIADNPKVLAQRFLVSSQKYQIREAYAQYLPQISLNAGYGPEYTSNTVTRTAGSSTQLTRRELGVLVRELVFDGGARSSLVRQRKANFQLSHAQLIEAQSIIALGTTEAYLNVVRWQTISKIYRKNVKSHEAMLDHVTKRTSAGAGKISDEQLINSRLALARSRLEQAQEQLDEARSLFEQFTGSMPPNELTPPKTPYIPAKTMQAAWKIAQKENPTLRSNREQITGAMEGVKETESSFWPTVAVELSANHRNSLDGVEGDNNDAQAVVVGRYTLYAGGERFAKLHSKEAAHRSATYEYKNNLRVIYNDVQTAWTFLIRSKESLNELDKHQSDALKVFNSYRKEFDINQRNLFDLLNSESEYYNARVTYINAKYDWLFDHFRLMSAMGTIDKYFAKK